MKELLILGLIALAYLVYLLARRCKADEIPYLPNGEID